MTNTILSFLIFCISISFITAQHSEERLVEEALNKYIEGRNTGKPDMLYEAFNALSDLRYVKDDTMRIWQSTDYISGIKPGKIHACKARIVSMDIEGNAAIAKIEIEYSSVKFADYINLLKIGDTWQIATKSFARMPVNNKRVLFVITSHEELGNTGRKTGLHLGEVSHVYKPIVDAGYEIDFVSPKGGKTYMYGADMNDDKSLWMIQNPSANYKLTHALTPDEVDPSLYAVIYFVGGHGTMWDLPNNNEINSITQQIYENDGIVAGVCHGPSGLVNVKLSNGDFLVKGKKMTAFTDNEEKAAGKEGVVPFLLETILKERGAVFSGAENWTNHVIVDGRLITGQNPASAYDLSQEILKQLEE